VAEVLAGQGVSWRAVSNGRGRILVPAAGAGKHQQNLAMGMASWGRSLLGCHQTLGQPAAGFEGFDGTRESVKRLVFVWRASGSGLTGQGLTPRH